MSDSVIRSQVEAMAAYGIAEPDIALVLEMDLETLRTDYGTELRVAAGLLAALPGNATGDRLPVIGDLALAAEEGPR